ncbi:MAG: PEGA domain-containing protein, partial [Kofleriaceae bacterium]
LDSPFIGPVTWVPDMPGADVLFDGTRLPNKTPLTVDGAPVGSHHTIRVELPHHTPFEESRDIPKDGHEISVMAKLEPLTGKLVINCDPKDAEIWINGELRGRAPTILLGLDLSSAKHLELRLKGYQPQVQDLVWPADGKIQIDAKLVH